MLGIRSQHVLQKLSELTNVINSISNIISTENIVQLAETNMLLFYVREGIQVIGNQVSHGALTTEFSYCATLKIVEMYMCILADDAAEAINEARLYQEAEMLTNVTSNVMLAFVGN